jgi:ABC-type Mn2+/Zn2+ transport system permease subunit
LLEACRDHHDVFVFDALITPFTDNRFLLHALIAGFLVAMVCGIAGTFVVLRGMAFVGDALAHGVLPGIATALLLGVPGVVGAAVGSVIMMGGVNLITRRSRLSGDTAIGLLFVGMVGAGVLIISRSRSFTGDLTRILFGEVLGVTTSDLWWQLVALGVVAALAWIARRPFLLLCVDEDLTQTSGFAVRRYHALMLALIAITVVASFQTVGTLLVFGMLIAPAATAALVVRRVGHMMTVAAVLGSVATYVGLLLSYHANLAAGASIVVTAVVMFLITLVAVEVRRGLMARRPVTQ